MVQGLYSIMQFISIHRVFTDEVHYTGKTTPTDLQAQSNFFFLHEEQSQIIEELNLEIAIEVIILVGKLYCKQSFNSIIGQDKVEPLQQEELWALVHNKLKKRAEKYLAKAMAKSIWKRRHDVQQEFDIGDKV